MDHPSKEWKNGKTQDLLEDKTRNKVLNYHFRFKGLVDENDYIKCLVWEQFRTEIFLKLRKQFKASSFPYSVEGFPSRPYLSYSNRERSKWQLSHLPKSPKDDLNNLLLSHLGSKEEIVLSECEKGAVVCHTPTLKIPIELHVHPYWDAHRLVKLFKEQVVPIMEKVKSNQRELEERGHVVLELQERKPIKTLKKSLKLLGHFRLDHCVDVDHYKFKTLYGDDYYTDESSMKRDIKNRFPLFRVFF
jgi:hypothetical protein